MLEKLKEHEKQRKPKVEDDLQKKIKTNSHDISLQYAQCTVASEKAQVNNRHVKKKTRTSQYLSMWQM